MESEAPLQGYRWKILVMIYACQISFALVFQSIPPVLRLIISDLGITHAQAGLLMSLFALPGIFIAIPGGMASDRYGARKVALSCLLLMIVGSLVVGVSANFSVMALGRVISGVGALTLAIVLPQLISSWFSGRELGLALGVFNSGMPVGVVISFNLLGRIGLGLGWRIPILVTTTVTVIALILFLLLFREADNEDVSVGSGNAFPRIGISIWLVGLAWMWFNCAFISFLTFAQDFFATQGYTAAFAGFLTSLVLLISIPLSPVSGYLIGRFGREEAFLAIGGIALAFIFLSMPSTSFPLILLALLGVFQPPFRPQSSPSHRSSWTGGTSA